MLREDSDQEFVAMLKEEIAELEERQENLEHRLQVLLIPKDPNDEKNVIVETELVRARKRLCLQVLCSACIPATLRKTAGGWKS